MLWNRVLGDILDLSGPEAAQALGISAELPRFRLGHIAGIVVAALFGLTVFGVLAWRSIRVERATTGT